MVQGKYKKLLTKMVWKGDRGFPIGTVAFYGPDNTRASKVVCGIIQYEDAEPDVMRKWFTDGDGRESEKILGELLSFMDENHVKSVAMVEEIIGCPHEEGIDYPEGESCPECQYWKNRNRFTQEIIH